jgi:hypothetical protein
MKWILAALRMTGQLGVAAPLMPGEGLPRKPGAVTVLKVDAWKVSAIEFAHDAQQIGGHLK